MEISEIESPFKPLMAGGDGSPMRRDLIDLRDDDDKDLMKFVSGKTVFEGKGQCINSLGIIPSGSEITDCESSSSKDSFHTGSDSYIPKEDHGSDGRNSLSDGEGGNVDSKNILNMTFRRRILFSSPIKIGSPSTLSESNHSSFLDKPGICAEDYFASLFSFCDREKTGIVRVSHLLDVLIEFQALEEDEMNSSSISANSKSEALEVLKELLDPSDTDPIITLENFTNGITTMVKSKNEKNKKNNERSDSNFAKEEHMENSKHFTRNLEARNKMNGNAESSNGVSKWSLQNSLQRPVFGSDSRPSLLDLSHLSSQSGSFEAVGVGGNASTLDPWDLQMEISELRFQVQKAVDESSDLKQQVVCFQEENLQLLSQKEDLEKRLAQRNLAQEKIKQIQRELDDAKHAISSADDFNSVLSSRIQRLERDYSESETKNKDLQKDNDAVTAELEKSSAKLRQRNEEIERVKTASEDMVKDWIAKEKWLESRLSNLNATLDELTETNSQLRKEKFELETNLVDLCGNQLALLNSPSVNGDINSPMSEVGLNRSYLRRSLHAEISATMERKRSLLQPLFGRESLVDVSTQFEKDEVEPEAKAEEIRRLSEMEYLRFWNLMKDIKQLIFQGPSNKDVAPDVEALASTTENGTKDGKSTQEPTGPFSTNNSNNQDDMVRHINQELAEFRQQLKKSQELFHALQSNGSSAQAISSSNVTQSCPLLAETEIVVKPKLVCCSTQTEPSVIDQQPRRSSSQQDGPARSLLDAIDDMDGDGDGNYLDKLSDDVSYRLTINLPTVLEESEQETETSPGAGPRRMSSCDKGRPRLVRMPNATEEESSDSNHKVAEEDEAFKSDNDYRSAASSLPGSVNTSAYNSLERPLQLSGAYGSRSQRNGDSDSVSIVSDGNTTYGSPISSPSSPTYWTPSQGSSSQETITNHDGDKTPVNDDGTDKYEALTVLSCPDSTNRPQYENGTGSLRKRGSSWGPTLPMYNRLETFSIGVIPDSQREHMIKYAYDPVRRSSEMDATILPGSEWRTLKKDLDKQDQDNYRKRFAQEEGNDVEGGSAMDSGSQRPYNSTDLDDEAEEYLESFPNLVEQLFKNLDIIKERERGPSEVELETISKRFNHLALTFKTEDINLAQRIELKLKEHDTSKSRMQEIIFSLSDSLQRLEDVAKTHKVPEEIIQLSSSLKHVAGDLDMHSSNLSRTSRRVGMMDVQIRLYKMIEVMVLYVNILRNLYDNVDKDFQNAKKLLDENNISFSSSKPTAKLNNNNNNEKVSWDNGRDGAGQSQRDKYGRPRQPLQLLLGPKESNAGLDYKLKETLVLKEKKSSTNVFIRYIADSYEALRCELFWPWNWEETWRGIKQGFSIILMIVGLFIIFRSVFPIVSANSEPQPMIADLSSVFSKHGNLDHTRLPPV